jgi:hypothetical protein
MVKKNKNKENPTNMSEDPILEHLKKCSTATRQTFLNNRILNTTGSRKCYQSKPDVINQMLGVISVPVHYLFDIQVNPPVLNEVKSSHVVTVHSFLSLELHLVPSAGEKENWVEVPSEYNVVDFVFRCLLQTPNDTSSDKQIDANMKKIYEKLKTKAKIYEGEYSPPDQTTGLIPKLNIDQKKQYNGELIADNNTVLKDTIKNGEKGLKVSFITFHYENKQYIAQLFIHIFTRNPSSFDKTATQFESLPQTTKPKNSNSKSQTPVPIQRTRPTSATTRTNSPSTPRSNPNVQIPELKVERINKNLNSGTYISKSARNLTTK